MGFWDIFKPKRKKDAAPEQEPERQAGAAPEQERAKQARLREDVDLRGEVRPASLMAAADRGQAHAAANPCACGGAWRMETFDSPMPGGVSGMVCHCDGCGVEKVFVFRFW